MQEISATVCVIGGGPAGYTASIRASQLGAKVILIERNELGGTCLNKGCIPTKSLLKTAETFAMTAKFKELGLEMTGVTIQAHPEIYMARKDALVKNLRMGLNSLMTKNKIEVLKGNAIILSPSCVKVIVDEDEVLVTCSKLIITTGFGTFNARHSRDY